jgi:hypothetical protein
VPFAARLTDALRTRGMQLCDALTLDEAEQAILEALHERATA